MKKFFATARLYCTHVPCMVVVVFLFIFFPTSAYCNNIVVTNGALINQDSTAKIIQVQFDISWDNSWRDTTNYDAAWVFFKYSTDAGTTWSHATLKSSGTNPTNFSIGQGTDINIVVPVDKKGCFIQRSDIGSGTLSASQVTVVWDYAADGVSAADADSPSTRIKIFAVEMVYVPEGSFLAGDANADRPGCFKGSASQAIPLSVTSEAAMIFTNTFPYYYQTGGNSGEFANGDSFTVSSVFPKGYHAFYCMKYEISEGQWIDFFNTLTDTQKATRDITSSNLNGKGSDTVVRRNAVSWTSDDATLVNNREFDRAMNFLSWQDVAAYADWAALRPMTELEFEKACRGPANPVNDEFAWGNTTIGFASTISGAEDGTETVTTAAVNANYNDITFTGGDAGKGPLRCGIFAKANTDRTASGASYYGILDLSGSVWERCVSVGNAAGLNFTGTNGDGTLTSSGNATNGDWPGIDATPANGVTGASGSGFRGGAANVDNQGQRLIVGDRLWAARTDSNRSDSSQGYWDYGGRCVRSAP